MRVGFSKVWGGLLLGLGVVCLLLALVAGGNLIGPMISGAVSIIAGISMLSRAYFEIGGGVLVVHAMIGPATTIDQNQRVCTALGIAGALRSVKVL